MAGISDRAEEVISSITCRLFEDKMRQECEMQTLPQLRTELMVCAQRTKKRSQMQKDMENGKEVGQSVTSVSHLNY